MDGPRTAGARFQATAARESTLTVAVRGNGTVSGPGIDCESDCEASFGPGQSVTLLAERGDGEEFLRWQDACVNTTPTCKLTLGSDKRVVAVFSGEPPVTEKPTLTVELTGEGGGEVTSVPSAIRCSKTCSTELAPDAMLTLTAIEDDTSRFAGWAGGGCDDNGTGPCEVTMDASKTVTARFEPKAQITTQTQTQTQTQPPVQYSLAIRDTNKPSSASLSASVDGVARPGCASGSCSFDAGSVVTVTTTGGYVTQWQGCDVDPGPGTSSCTVTMSTSKFLSVTFGSPPVR